MHSYEDFNGNMRGEFWRKQSAIREAIDSGGIRDYMESLSNLDKAFVLNDKTIHCIDERTPGGIHAAGSLILVNEEEALEFLKRSGANGITSHRECGAVKLWAGQNGKDLSGAEKYAEEWSRHLAELATEKLGRPVEYKGHLEVTPSGFHVAQIVYLDETGRFNPVIPNLLPGFVISRRFENPGQAMAELDIAIKIALGDHGFGDLITPETPFLITTISDPFSKKAGTDDELSSFLDKLPEEVLERLRTVEFIPPKKFFLD